jgi:hypothetical protein
MRVLFFTYAHFAATQLGRKTRAGCIKISVPQQKCMATLRNDRSHRVNKKVRKKKRNAPPTEQMVQLYDQY